MYEINVREHGLSTNWNGRWGCTEGGRGGGAGIRMVGYPTIERGGVVGERKGGSCYHKGQIKGEEGAKGNKINNINMTEERDIWSTEWEKNRTFL